MSHQYRCHDRTCLPGFAEQLLESYPGERVIAIEGEMGAGKTTLIQQLCRTLGSSDIVSSPTFSLVNQYRGQGCDIFHFDLYRLEKADELLDIGFTEYVESGAWCFIEWPELAVPFIHSSFIRLSIGRVPDPEGRVFRWELIA